MLEVLNKIICSSIMLITGIYVVRKIIGDKSKLTLKSYIWLILFLVIAVTLSPIQYTMLYSITIFLLNIATYKIILNTTIQKSTIATSLFMAILFISDFITMLLFRAFFTVNQIRTNQLVSIIGNIMTSIICITVINIKVIFSKMVNFFNDVERKMSIVSLIYPILLILGFCLLGYNISFSETYGKMFSISYIISIIFTALACLFLESRNSYNKLSDEYDTLFNYIQNFEDWIEKEELNRHEYKNQLAVIRSITKDKKVQKQIDEILQDSLNVEDKLVCKLKDLSKGGLNGLMYYKIAIAQKKNINIEVDVSLKPSSILKHLTENQTRILCKLIGIYFDNAIEAAEETDKKIVIVEIYDIKNVSNIVISNTFIKKENFSKRNERGVSTKGSGRGNGLYYAANLINKNKWVEAKQEVLDYYYIQTITIKKLV